MNMETGGKNVEKNFKSRRTEKKRYNPAFELSIKKKIKMLQMDRIKATTICYNKIK